MRWNWSHGGRQGASFSRLRRSMDIHGVAIISPRLAAFWLISFREQRQTPGEEHLRNVDAKGDQTVSIRRLSRLDLTNDNALRYQGTSV